LEKELETEFEKKAGSGKAKIGLVVCAFLVVILAISSLVLLMRVNSLQNEVDHLTVENDFLQNEVDYLTVENDFLQNEVDYLTVEYEYLEWQLDQAQFDFYYVFPPEQQFGVYTLAEWIGSGYWIDPYEMGVFDCGEMSAYMEWELENLGWNTLIVVGDAPFGDGYHAWILVEVEQEGYIPVETTSMEIIWWENLYFDNYFVYDYAFEDIRDALAYNESEFDWWE